MTNRGGQQALHLVRGRGPVNTPLRLLLVCLAVSLAFHALVIVYFPRLNPTTLGASTPVLDVVIVTREAEPVPLAPAVASAARSVEPKVAHRESPVPVAEPPTRMATDIPILTARELKSFPAPPASVAADEPQPAPATSPEPVLSAQTVAPVVPPVFNAAYLRNMPPRYPVLARRNNEEGTVMVGVLVSAGGVPLRVDLETPSGSASLDEAALDAVRNWRFVPARRGTQPIEGRVRVPIVFRLDG